MSLQPINERADMPPIDLAGREHRRRFGHRVSCACGREVWASINSDAAGFYLWARRHNTPRGDRCWMRCLPIRDLPRRDAEAEAEHGR